MVYVDREFIRVRTVTVGYFIKRVKREAFRYELKFNERGIGREVTLSYRGKDFQKYLKCFPNVSNIEKL